MSYRIIHRRLLPLAGGTRSHHLRATTSTTDSPLYLTRHCSPARRVTVSEPIGVSVSIRITISVTVSELGARHALPFMPPGSSIIALSSLGAGRVLPGYTIVDASKAAIESLVRYLAVELAPKVRVSAVSPGVVDTDALRHFPQRDEMLNVARTSTPMGRLVEPEDVAATIDFLVSDAARMITGQTIVVDGGWLLRQPGMDVE